MIHFGFDEPGTFERNKAYPSHRPRSWDWLGLWASQSPLNVVYQTFEGGGAEGSPGYLALPGACADQFYVETTPVWQRPRVVHDLRDTEASFYLKAVTPIRVEAGYAPRLFVADVTFHDDLEYRHSITGWYVTEPLRVGDTWTPNRVALRNDERLWTRYTRAEATNVEGDHSLDAVLKRTGFIGVMYLRGTDYTGVNARGILGLDEFRYTMPLPA